MNETGRGALMDLAEASHSARRATGASASADLCSAEIGIKRRQWSPPPFSRTTGGNGPAAVRAADTGDRFFEMVARARMMRSGDER